MRPFDCRPPDASRPFRAVGSAASGGRCARALPCRSRRGYSAPAMTRSRSRSAARLAAVQALYQQEMEGTPIPRLLHEFHQHRLGATIGDDQYAEAEVEFFDDVVSGADARKAELDALISERLAEGWSLARLDRPMRAILRAGASQPVARPDVPGAS